MRNRRGAICVVDKLDLITRPRAGASRRLRIPGARRRRARHVSRAAGDGEGAARRPRHGARVGRRPARPARGQDRRSAGARANTRVVGRLHVEHGVLFVVAEDKRISQDFLVPPGEARDAQARAGGDGGDHRSSRPRRRSRWRAWSRCSATMPIPAWKSRSRCASTNCRTSFRRRGRASSAENCPNDVPKRTAAGAGPARTAAGDDRRRDRARLRRRGVLRAATAAASGWWWRSPTSAITCSQAMRSTRGVASAATRFIFRAA